MSTPPVQSRVLVAPPPRMPWWLRLLPSPNVAIAILAALGVLVLASGTGYGANSETDPVTANILATISLTPPTSLEPDPPVCSTAISALNADGCTGTYTPGTTDTLRLGELAVTDVEAARGTWLVTTTSTSGYSVQLRNAGTGHVLRSSNDSIPDMPASPMTPATAVDTTTQFGVSVGDPVADNQASVAYGGSPWVTAAGEQGALFRGVPRTGMVVAQRTTPQVNDPFSLTFAAASIFSEQPKNGEYTGLVRLTASVV